MKTKLSIEVEFDGDQTDAESLASAANTLLQTALSTPGVLHEFGNPQFGEFFIEQPTVNRHRFEQAFSTECFCPQNPAGHEPDWTSVHIEFDGDAYVDVVCKHCGRSGCVGPEKALASETSWLACCR